MAASKSFIFRFADVEVREREFCLIRSGEVLAVEPKPFRVLLFLLRNPQKLISKEELLNEVWGDAAVTENSLARSIAKLRRQLQDDIREPRYIATVATIGYRFVCKVEVSEDRSDILGASDQPSVLSWRGSAETHVDGGAADAVLKKTATGQTPYRTDSTITVFGVNRSSASVPLVWLNPDVSVGPQLLKRDAEGGQRPEEGLSAVAVPKTTTARVAKPWRVAVSVSLIALLVAGGLYYRWHQLNERMSEKDTIVLADFSNSTGDAVFDGMLNTALDVSLRQSPFLNVLPDNEVLKTLQLMTRQSGTNLTPEVARELCLRAGSKAYVAGAIAILGSEYVVGLKAVNCQSGMVLAKEQVTASSKDQVLSALAHASSRLRSELGESLATVQKFDVPLELATTSSLEALKVYSLGRKLHNEKGSPSSLPYYQRAVQLDPNFALAYVSIGDDYNGLFEPGQSREYFTKAFQFREHASEREKHAIDVRYYSGVTGEVDKAVQTSREWVESYPRDLDAYAMLRAQYDSQGLYEKAAEISRQALHLGQDRAYLYNGLAMETMALQSFDETRQIVREAQARRLDNGFLHSVLYALAFLGSDSAAMAAQRQWYAGKPGYECRGLSLASDTEAYSGHLAKARDLTRQAVESATRSNLKETGAISQALAAQREAAYGYPIKARKFAAEALKMAPASQGVESEAALAFAMAGDTGQAVSLAQSLAKRFPLDTGMHSHWLPAIQAQLALARMNPHLALNALQADSAIELGNTWFTLSVSCLNSVYLRGEAYLAAGQGGAAAQEFQKILDHSGIVWNCWTGAMAHLGVARANALQSRTSQGSDADVARVRALAAYKNFLNLWKDADPGIPILKQAQAEYARLK